MQPDLQELRITQTELEKLTGLDISDAFMGRAFRPCVFRHFNRFVSFLITELFTFGLIVIVCLPLSLIVARNFSGFTGDIGSTLLFLQVTLGLSVAIALIWNLYLWRKSIRLKTLGHLLDEVDKHNEIIQAVDVMDELGAVQHSSINLINREDVISALQATRASLVCALMTEKILRTHQRLIARRHELFSNIETNLATLQTLKINDQAHDYGELLNEALAIGLSVHREIRQSEQRS